MEFLVVRDHWWLSQCEAALLSQGIEVSSHRLAAPGRGTVLDVPASEAEHASQILSELLAEERARQQAHPPLSALARGPLLLQPAFAFAVSLAALIVAFFWVTGPASFGGRWFNAGVLFADKVADSPWRMITAVTLHADWEHVLGNAGFVLVLGWAAAERAGAGVAALIWLIAGVAGFVSSMLFADVHATLGASGGVFGLLGASGIHAARHIRVTALERRERILGPAAAILLLAFTAFSPSANIAAHVGGFVAGGLVGMLLPARRMKALAQLGAGLVVVTVVAAAWSIALANG